MKKETGECKSELVSENNTTNCNGKVRDKSDVDERKWKLINWGASIGVPIALVLGYFVPVWMGYKPPENAAAFGDMWGFANAIISGLALIGVVFAVTMQSRQLSLQKTELKDTRAVLVSQEKQLTEQSTQFKNQNLLMDKQRVEATFFQMLRLHDALVFKIGEIERMQRSSTFEVCVDRIRESFHPNGASKNDTVATTFAGPLASYFGSVNAILEFIGRVADESQKKFFAMMFNARLTVAEKQLIACYSSLSGLTRFKVLVESLGVLHNIPVEQGKVFFEKLSISLTALSAIWIEEDPAKD